MEEKLCAPHFRCVLKCVLDVTCLEMDVYVALLKNGEMDVNNIVKAVKKDKSNVYKSLQNLMKKGLISRKYRILRTGGYKYLYSPIPFDDVKQEMHDKIEKWLSEVGETLEEFDKIANEIELVNMLDGKNSN